MSHELTKGNKASWIEEVWNALHYIERDNEYSPDYMTDEQWDEVCTAMAWITEEVLP